MHQFDLTDDQLNDSYMVQRAAYERIFTRLGLDYEQHVKVDPAFFRPVDVHVFYGDPTKARKVLGWEPSITFRALVEMLVDADLERVRTPRELAAYLVTRLRFTGEPACPSVRG